MAITIKLGNNGYTVETEEEGMLLFEVMEEDAATRALSMIQLLEYIVELIDPELVDGKSEIQLQISMEKKGKEPRGAIN